MTNRQPTPGREGHVKLILDNGQVLSGKLEMDDDPLEDGTPWAKETVLTDRTAAIMHLSSFATPDDMFSAIAMYLSGNYKEYTFDISESIWAGDAENGYMAIAANIDMNITDAMVFVSPEYSADSSTRRQQMLSLSCVNQVKVSGRGTVQLIAFNKKPPYDFSIRLGVIERV